MSKTYSRPISIQKINDESELWEDVYTVHASINKAQDNNEYLQAGAIQDKRRLVFEIRYFKDLEDVALNLSYYRICYNGVIYNLISYDDYMLLHRTVKLLGESV